MDILAHRANLNGANVALENTLEATTSALAEGFGVETDLRRDERRRLYIAHDRSPWSPGQSFESFVQLFRTFPDRCVALNVKETGYESTLLDLQLAGAFGARSFLFDFELLESEQPGRSQALIRALPKGSEAVLAARLSDRGETLTQCLAISAQVVWLDEFDSLWITAREIDALRAAGRRLYAVSPELHGFDDESRIRRWREFKAWGLDGICTDFALSARDALAR